MMFCGGRCTSGPRVYGTTQYVQNLLHPRVIRTYAWRTSSPGETLRDRSSISRWSSAAASVLDRRTPPPSAPPAAAAAASAAVVGHHRVVDQRRRACRVPPARTADRRAGIVLNRLTPSRSAMHPITPITSPGSAALRRPQFPEPRPDLLLGVLAHGTGVEQDHVRALAVFDRFVSLGAKLPENQLAVEHVHLAAEGFQVQLAAACGRPIRQENPGIVPPDRLPLNQFAAGSGAVENAPDLTWHGHSPCRGRRLLQLESVRATRSHGQDGQPRRRGPENQVDFCLTPRTIGEHTTSH